MKKKCGFPFRLGCTSYVIPADIVPNVEKMAPIIDDIELVLFESSDISNMPDARVIRELVRLAEIHGNTYTVHFPTDRKAGSESASERAFFVDQIRTVMELTRPISPHAWILHLEGVDSKQECCQRMEWEDRVSGVCSTIASLPGLERAAIAVETLEYPHLWMKPFVDGAGFSYCFDVGHAWLYGHDWLEMTQQLMSKTAVVHLHGVAAGVDHKSLKVNNEKQLTAFLGELRRFEYSGVVTLEVFSEQETFESIELVKNIWEQ